mmetsp:Transcript_1908/g.2928  ORF Transcript_1908/g.2928 Transcript_1908/m.2928 type:complete len:268 (-) Transcript_1908:68-871(-)
MDDKEYEHLLPTIKTPFYKSKDKGTVGGHLFNHYLGWEHNRHEVEVAPATDPLEKSLAEYYLFPAFDCKMKKLKAPYSGNDVFLDFASTRNTYPAAMLLYSISRLRALRQNFGDEEALKFFYQTLFEDCLTEEHLVKYGDMDDVDLQLFLEKEVWEPLAEVHYQLEEDSLPWGSLGHDWDLDDYDVIESSDGVPEATVMSLKPTLAKQKSGRNTTESVVQARTTSQRIVNGHRGANNKMIYTRTIERPVQPRVAARSRVIEKKVYWC